MEQQHHSQNTQSQERPLIKPVVVDRGEIAQITNGQPQEILDEFGSFYCIEAVDSLRTRE